MVTATLGTGVLTVHDSQVVLTGRALRIALLLAHYQEEVNRIPHGRVYADCGDRPDDVRLGIDARLPPLT